MSRKDCSDFFPETMSRFLSLAFFFLIKSLGDLAIETLRHEAISPPPLSRAVTEFRDLGNISATQIGLCNCISSEGFISRALIFVASTHRPPPRLESNFFQFTPSRISRRGEARRLKASEAVRSEMGDEGASGNAILNAINSASLAGPRAEIIDTLCFSRKQKVVSGFTRRRGIVRRARCFGVAPARSGEA